MKQPHSVPHGAQYSEDLATEVYVRVDDWYRPMRPATGRAWRGPRLQRQRGHEGAAAAHGFPAGGDPVPRFVQPPGPLSAPPQPEPVQPNCGPGSRPCCRGLGSHPAPPCTSWTPSRCRWSATSAARTAATRATADYGVWSRHLKYFESWSCSTPAGVPAAYVVPASTDERVAAGPGCGGPGRRGRLASGLPGDPGPGDPDPGAPQPAPGPARRRPAVAQPAAGTD